ncbi:hypothetical protein A9977_21915 [Variovorax sp. UMC13]|nr:hypothetical protein [Variovorax sp. UMC13]
MNAYPMESTEERAAPDDGLRRYGPARAPGTGQDAVAVPHPADAWVDSMATPCRCVFVFIGNAPHLAQAFSEGLAEAVSQEVGHRLRALAMATVGPRVVQIRDDCFLLWSHDAEAGGPCVGSPRVSEDIEHLLSEISAEPVCFDGLVALPELHAGWIEVSDPRTLDATEIDLILWAAQQSPSLDDVRAEDWRAGYRADMAIAVRVWEAARTGRLQTRWQAVVDAHAGGATLYRESCVHVPPTPEHHSFLAPGTYLPCLERLRLTRAFDRCVAHQVLDTLRQRPGANMGLNLSAHSARLDHWWALFLERLSREPLLARRLVVEVDCARAPLQDAEAVRDFCRCLAAYGCRIAMDAFGSGVAGLTFVQACKPDIVKLEAAFVRRAGENPFGFESLKDMLALCARLARRTVVDGIDREADLHVAMRAGAQWLQGCYLGGAQAPARHPAPVRRGVASTAPAVRATASASMRRETGPSDRSRTHSF